MKRYIFIFYTAITITGSSAEYYLSTYAVDPEIKAILDEHRKIIDKKVKKIHGKKLSHALGVWQFDWLPGYYIKYGAERIKGMHRIKKCIKNYNLDLVSVPDKRLYHIPGRPEEFNDRNYVIVVKAVEKEPQPLTVEQVKQLCTIIKKTGYMDMTDTNYRRAPDGKLYIIDTEGFNKSRIIKGFLRMIGTKHDLNTDYTPEALKYLFAEIKSHLNDNPHLVRFTLNRLDEFLGWQEKPYAWDYIGYAHKHLSEYYANRSKYSRYSLNPF